MNALYVGFGWIWWNYSISSSYCDGCESIRWVSIGFTISKNEKKTFPRVNKLSLEMLPIPVSESCLPTTWWNCVFPENYDIQDDLKMIHMILARQTSRNQQ